MILWLGQYSSEQPGNMWLLKRSRKGMELNNPYAFNLKPQSLRSVIDRIPLLPLVGCSQIEYVRWKKQVQPCVPDSRYRLQKSSALQKIMYPEEMRTWVSHPQSENSKSLGYQRNVFHKDYTHYDEHTLTHRRSAYFFDEESRSMYRYHAVPRISKSDFNCCFMNKSKKSNSDMYMPVIRTPSQSTSVFTQSPQCSKVYSTTLPSPISQKMFESAQEQTVKTEIRLSKKYLPMAQSESISVLSKQSTITTQSVEEARQPPPLPPKKKGFCHTFFPCCFGEGDDDHSVVIYQDAPRYVCKVTTPSLSGSSLLMEGGENLERRTKYICKLKS